MGGLTGEIITNSLGEVLPIALLIIGIGLVLCFAVYGLMTRVFHSKNALAYALVAPAAVGLAIFVLFPLIFNIVIAFSNWKLVNFKNPSFGWEYGVANFTRVFSDQLLNTPESTFGNVFLRTILWTGLNVVFHVLGGLGLALLLNRQLKLRGFYRTLLIIPWAIPQVIAALAWRGEFNYQYGFINIVLRQLGIQGPPTWLQDGTWAFVAVLITNIWLGIPFMMVVILGGLQSIAGEYFEAAEIDGATRWQQFRSVTLPMLRPVLGPAVTLGTIWTFNNFNVIFLITGGGPAERTNILVTALYNAAFGFSRYGFAAMFSLVIFAILFVFCYFWIRYSGALKGVYD
jgi:arabinogalactan oligomer / maltooligosaccharide transport system permease protein